MRRSAGEMKILLGIAFGIIITLFLLFYFRKTSYEPQYHPIITVSDSSFKNKTELAGEITTLKIANNLLEEKLGSINKRFDDVLIFGGIIVTLLLAINVGVYVKAENEVKRHFEEHFDRYKKKMQGDAEEVKVLLAQVRADAESAQKLKKSFDNQQKS